ncbi:MAG: hypothetical protein ACYC6Y_01955, partial [Thermoguttaceae bacterium]
MEPSCPIRRVCRGACLILLLVGCVGCRRDTAPSPPRERATSEGGPVRETWEMIFLSGQRVGHIHTSVFRESHATGDVLRIEHEEVLNLRSNNNQIQARTAITARETPDGRLVDFTSALPQGSTPLETVGRVVGNELHLEVAAGAQKTQVSLPWDPQYGGPYRVNSSLLEDPLSPGETRTLRYLDVATNQLATRTMTAAGFEET